MLGEDAEDEVRRRLGQKAARRLRRVTPALSDELAASDGDLGLVEVVGIVGIFGIVGIDEDEQAAHLVLPDELDVSAGPIVDDAIETEQARYADHCRDDRDDEPATRDAADEQDAEPDDEDDERRAQVLAHEQDEGNEQDAEQLQEVDAPRDRPLVLRRRRANRQDGHRFGELGGLEG